MTPIEKFTSRLRPGRRPGQYYCEAHGDKRPSLYVKEGRDGRVLLRCWAGCSAEAICAAIGLELRDLFVHREYVPDVIRPAASDEEVCEFLLREAERQLAARLEYKPFSEPYYVSADLNNARRRANLLFARQLKPVPPFVWEGYDLCHAADPDWPDFYNRALQEVTWKKNVAVGFEPDHPLDVTQGMREAAYRLAASWIHMKTAVGVAGAIALAAALKAANRV
jgi:hypothetical protein